MTFHHLARPERDFPIARAWSTSGWIASGVFVGWLWPRVTGVTSIEFTNVPLKIAFVGELVIAAFCLLLPHTPPTNKRAAGFTGGFSRSQTLDLIRDPGFIMLMALAVIAHAPSQFYYAYFNVYLNTWIEWTGTAAKMTLGQVVEVACMLLLPAVLLRVSVKTSILIGLSVWTARFWMISLSASRDYADREALLYSAILLHGFAFTLVTISLQMEVDRHAGRRRRATAQGMLSVAMSGIGCFIGSELAGLSGARLLGPELGSISSPRGWEVFWQIPAGIMALVLLLTAAFLPRGRRNAAFLAS
jgi:hypothetical protein